MEKKEAKQKHTLLSRTFSLTQFHEFKMISFAYYLCVTPPPLTCRLSFHKNLFSDR